MTWVGKDSDSRTCQSDNFRLSGFTDFGMKSYFDAAKDLSTSTYPDLVSNFEEFLASVS